MAITILKQPQILSPVYNPMIVVADSTNKGNENYQLVADIFVRGVDVSKVKIPVNPDGVILFDLQRHIENEITFDFNPTNSGFNKALLSGATYSVDFSEEWRYVFNFESNIELVGNKVGFRGPNNGPQPVFSVGDRVVVAQSPGATHPFYNGEVEITNIVQQFVFGVGLVWIIETDKDFISTTSPEGGTIRLSNFRLTTFTSSVVLDKKWAFNGVLDFYDDIEWDSDVRTIKNTSSKFLTNAPQVYECFEDEYMWLNFYQQDVVVDKLRVEPMGIDITNPFDSPLVNDDERVLQVAVGPANLFTASVPTDYTIQLFNDDGDAVSELRTIKIKKKCSKFQKIQLVFLDKLGSFIPFTFNMVSREFRDIERSSYQQKYGKYAPATQDWTYNSWDRGEKVFDTVINERFTINSDWVRSETSDFLMTLFESPEVYMFKDGRWTAINLTVSNVERKQTINDQIINYTLTFNLSNKKATQR